jgi:hypothetical protein
MGVVPTAGASPWKSNAGLQVYAACFVPLDALSPVQGSHEAPHPELHESLLPHSDLSPHESDLSPHGSHLLAQEEVHSLPHVLLPGSHLLKVEKHAAMAFNSPSVVSPPQGLHLVEHVGGLQGLHPLPTVVLSLLD